MYSSIACLDLGRCLPNVRRIFGERACQLLGRRSPNACLKVGRRLTNVRRVRRFAERLPTLRLPNVRDPEVIRQQTTMQEGERRALVRFVDSASAFVNRRLSNVRDPTPVIFFLRGTGLHFFHDPLSPLRAVHHFRRRTITFHRGEIEWNIILEKLLGIIRGTQKSS